MEKKHRWLIHFGQNKAVTFSKVGNHRVYSNNKRKGSKHFVVGFKQTYGSTLRRLLSWGYQEVTQEVYNGYFNQKPSSAG